MLHRHTSSDESVLLGASSYPRTPSFGSDFFGYRFPLLRVRPHFAGLIRVNGFVGQKIGDFRHHLFHCNQQAVDSGLKGFFGHCRGSDFSVWNRDLKIVLARFAFPTERLRNRLLIWRNPIVSLDSHVIAKSREIEVD